MEFSNTTIYTIEVVETRAVEKDLRELLQSCSCGRSTFVYSVWLHTRLAVCVCVLVVSLATWKNHTIHIIEHRLVDPQCRQVR